MRKSTGFPARMAPALLLILALGIWETGYRREWWAPRLFPGPSEVGRSLFEGLRDGSLLVAVRISLLRLLSAFSIALILGVAFGLLSGSFHFFDRTIGAVALGLQTLPSICWLPIAVVWFGVSEGAILLVTLMGSLLAVTIAVSDGIRSIPPIYYQAGSMMGAVGWRLYRDVIIPAALPWMITGAKQGWAFGWRSLMAGELIVNSAPGMGLGQVLTSARNHHNSGLMFAVMVLLVCIGYLSDRIVFSSIETTVRARWGLSRS